MKKVVALLMAAVLTVGMTVTAFATPSPSANSDIVTAAKDADGNAIDLSDIVVSEKYDAADQSAVDAIKADPQAVLASVVGQSTAANYSLALLRDVKVIGNVKFPVTLTFKIAGVTASSKVIVLHYYDGSWHQENPTVGDGTVTVTFDRLSPGAFYVQNANGSGNGGNGGNGANGNGSGSQVVSPKTGSSPVMMYAVIAAVVAAAGMCVTYKKKRA